MNRLERLLRALPDAGMRERVVNWLAARTWQDKHPDTIPAPPGQLPLKAAE